MPTSFPTFGARLAVLFVSLALPLLVLRSPGGLADPQHPLVQPTPTTLPSFFEARIYTKTLERPFLPQDVEGFILDRTGLGLAGIRVRASAGGWEAYDTTRGDGLFRFTLNEGQYAIQPIGLDSEVAWTKVDGRAQIRIEFRERSPLTPTPPLLPTWTPTVSPTATLTPTLTATPIITIEVGLRTPTPTPTPLLGAARPLEASPTPLPTTRPPSPLISPFSLPELSLKPWVDTFFLGAGLGAFLFILAALVILLRR